MLDGTVWFNRPNWGWVKLATQNYCVDGLANFGEGVDYRGLPTDQILFVCPSDIPNAAVRLHNCEWTKNP